MEESPIGIGTVPIYEAAVNAAHTHGAIRCMTEDDMLDVIRRHCEGGVDFVTIHCGVTLSVLAVLKRKAGSVAWSAAAGRSSPSG